MKNGFRASGSTIEGRLSLHEAALALRLSARQVLRLKRRTLDEGPRGGVPRTTARAPANKTPDGSFIRPVGWPAPDSQNVC